ncbi:glycosyltransferase family 2 protein [uncultured Psychroserpens sp.]|uniref:glycosyltransferase family 2 protein n=1 Tax=uncultured Psychroserpens sp. TaxID=255436 RepID=UPI002622795F|nr:glycosyltransferase family 2 protein [uncultured Psychroserpens sp.]
MTPYFSIIISVYNKAAYVADTLTSVLDQSYSNFEVIVVNDGSTDESLEILERFDDFRLQIINQDNHGASHARNHGINLAKGRYIALLDGDDLWDSHFLETMHTTIDNHPTQSIFTSAIAHKYDDNIVPVPYSFKIDKDVLILDYFEASQKHSALSGSSTVFKRDILDITGNFDERIRSGQDTDLWIRFGIHFPVVFVSKVLVYYVFNRQSLSNTTSDINLKPKFDKYKEEENTNFYLKKFLDRNRFSLAILSKLNGDCVSFEFFRTSLSLRSLSLKRKILIMSPKWVISLLLKLKSITGKKLYYDTL